jgi:CHAT domain-containing protein
VIFRQTTFTAGMMACVAAWGPSASAAPAAAAPCVVEPGRTLLDRRVSLAGNGVVRLPVPASSAALLQVSEEGIDVAFDVEDASGNLLAQGDNPIARQGVQHAELPARHDATFLIIKGKEHARLTGYVRVLLSVPTRARAPDGCMSFVRLMARADATYAAAVRQLSAVVGSQAKSDNEGFARALDEYRRVGTVAGERTAFAGRRGVVELSTAALYYYHLADWKESAAWAERAMSSFSQTQDAYLRARAEALRDAAWIELPNVDSRHEEARASLDRLAAFHRSRSQLYDEALQTNNIGLAYYNQARFEEAVRHYAIARDSFERLGETPRFALAIQNIALCDWGLGRWQSAANAFARALQLMRPDPYLDLYLLTLNNSAMAHLAAGMFDGALSQHSRAYELAERAGMEIEVARSLYGIGVTYYAIGDARLARDFLRRALARLTPRKTLVAGREVIKEPDTRARLATLRALATLEQESGAYGVADDHYREASTLATAPNVRARIQLRQALGEMARQRHATALEIATKFAQGNPDVDAVTQALAKVVRAKVLRAAGDVSGATADLTAAIAIFTRYRALSDEFDARVELARTHREAGRRGAALEELLAAIASSEELRAQTANPVNRASVTNDIRPALDFALALYREQYDERRAAGAEAEVSALARKSLELADTSRAQSLHQLLMQRQEPGENPRLSALADERARLLRDLADRRYYLAVRAERAADDAIARSLRDDIDSLRASLDVVENDIAKAVAGREIAAGERQVSQFSPAPGSAAVEYWVGERTAYAWVVSRQGVSWISLGDAARIDAAARSLTTSLAGYYRFPNAADASSIVESQSQELHRLVMQPLRAALGTGETLTVVPDGALHLVPFAMLRASAREPYLIQRTAIRHTPALWLNTFSRVARPRNTGGRILLISDPVYQSSDERVDRPNAGGVASTTAHGARLREAVDPARLERLAGSMSEAAGIGALFAKSDVEEMNGLDAVRARVLERDFAKYRFVHIAAHAVVDAEIPSLSSLVLGAFDRNGRVEDQQIRVGDLLDKRFTADLVVLSACNTSVGRSYAQEGPLGMHYAVLARGARAVVASLWPVADETNTELMTELYRRMVKRGERVDIAFAGAMRTQIAAHPDRDPVFWATYNTYAID